MYCCNVILFLMQSVIHTSWNCYNRIITLSCSLFYSITFSLWQMQAKRDARWPSRERNADDLEDTARIRHTPAAQLWWRAIARGHGFDYSKLWCDLRSKYGESDLLRIPWEYIWIMILRLISLLPGLYNNNVLESVLARRALGFQHIRTVLRFGCRWRWSQRCADTVGRLCREDLGARHLLC